MAKKKESSGKSKSSNKKNSKTHSTSKRSMASSSLISKGRRTVVVSEESKTDSKPKDSVSLSPDASPVIATDTSIPSIPSSQETPLRSKSIKPAPVSAESSSDWDEFSEKSYSDQEFNEFLKFYDQSLSGVEEGKVIKGRILKITEKDVFIDINFKSEGVVPITEFKSTDELKVNNVIDVYLESVEDQDGQVVLSKSKADFMMVWNQIREAHERGAMVRGKLVRRIKGGIVVDLFGVDAFLPGSQIDLRAVQDMDNLLGKEMDFKIIKVNKIRRNIVVSRRVVLEETRQKMRSQVLQELEKTQVREGIVKNITDFGAFIDLGGVDGLLHITDMSWGRVSHPSEVVALGETIKVKVLDFDENKERISLGLKQLQEYPWKDADKKYPVGSKIKGKVVSITDYGAFVELEKGIEGLVHISEMSWTQHVKHPSTIVGIGDRIEVVVLNLDVANEKISLGLKQLLPDPWTNIEKDYAVGTHHRGMVKNLAAFGAFIEIKEGIEGLVHISDMSWTKKVNHPSEIVKKGETIEVRILNIDREKRRISMGIKQLKDDPWDKLKEIYQVGTDTRGKIVRLLDRGVILELPDQVEGFIPANQLTTETIRKPAAVFKTGEDLPVRVVEFDQANRKIVLSVTEYYKDKQDEEYRKYLEQHKVPKTKVEEFVSDKEQ